MHSQPKLHISHFGVRGMKWGVRKRSGSEEAARAKKFGGKKKPKEMSEDAQKAADTLGKAKEKSVSSLSNREIQEFNNRMNLERQFNSLAPATGVKAVEKFVKEQIGVGKTMNEVYAFSRSPVAAAIKEGIG